MTRKAVDWAAIEADYRAGVKTDRQIGREHGLSHVAIGKRAKKEGWSRDLAARIRAKAREKVSKDAVTNKLVTNKRRTVNLVTDNAIVEANAEVVAAIQRDHRGKARRLFNQIEQLTDELESTAIPITRKKLLQMACDLAKLQSGKDKEAYKKALVELFAVLSQLPGVMARAAMLKTLSETLKTLTGIERQAYGIDENPGAPESALIAALKEIRGLT